MFYEEICDVSEVFVIWLDESDNNQEVEKIEVIYGAVIGGLLAVKNLKNKLDMARERLEGMTGTTL